MSEKRVSLHTERFTDRQAVVLDEARRRVAEVKERALTVHAHVLAERNDRAAQVRESLKATIARVNAQQRAVAASLRQQAVSRDAHVAVTRGLESLGELVRVIRDTHVSEEKMMEAVRDPVMSGTYFDRERRASASSLVQSLQRQLVQQYEFLNVAAHELRTPIMPILANAELLYDRLGTDTKELDTIMRNGLRLQRLAENILSAAKIESGTQDYRKERFDLNRLLRQTIQDLDYTIRNKSVRIIFIPSEEEAMVVGDEGRLGQVVTNLLDNALKFTQEGKVSVTSRTSGGLVEVKIADEGPGVDPKIYPVLFSKFVTKSSRGTGLGLFICRNIIEAHGGVIWATNIDSPMSHGSVFTFVIPSEATKRQKTL
jgi:signal transduction histidine kinase